MGDQEEVQEQMKADMSALKKQMASMMDAMLGMKKLMENNAATAATISSAVEADPTLPTTAHQPIPNVVGRERSTLGYISNPHPGYNRVAYPYGLPPNYTPPIIRDDAGHVPPPILEGEPPRQSDEVHEDCQEHAKGDIDYYSLFPIEASSPSRGRHPTHYLSPTSRENLETPQHSQYFCPQESHPRKQKKRGNSISSKRD